jgi:hypothetical protein
MTQDIDHTTCSARLRAYVAGALDDRTAAAVARHLESCPQCAGERRAVALLQHEPAPLAPEERARLHAAVRDSRRARPAATPTWRRRLAPALAAAAVLVALAVGAPFVLSGGGRSGLDAGGGGGATGDTAEGRAQPDQPAARAAAESAGLTATAARPRFDASAGALSRARLRRMAGQVPLERVTTDSVEEVQRLGEELADRLVRQAPPQVAGQVRECVEVVLRNSPAALPVRGAAGKLDGSDVVVVAFARGAGGRGALDGYQVWAWPQGSCDAPVSFQAGRAR